MRLTCPTCGAEYEIADAMVPADGRHVQCTACHTRWFVRRAAEPAPDASGQAREEEIMQRLEARSHLRAVPAPPAQPVDVPPVPAAAPEPAPAEPVPPKPAAAAPGPEPVPTPASPVAKPARAAPSAPASPRAVPAKPAERPMLTGDGLALRPAPRLDLAAERGTPPPPREAPAPSRFGLGFLVAVVLFGLALSTYLWRAELAARVPAAGPALDAYGRAVDDLRLGFERMVDKTGG